MQQKKQRIMILAVTMLLLLAFGAAVRAQTSIGFNLEWHVIGGGGNESRSVDYRVQGTIGQSVTSPPTASSAGFVVSSGYWLRGTPAAPTHTPTAIVPTATLTRTPTATPVLSRVWVPLVRRP